MEMIKVTGSSNIDRIGYDTATEILRVLFKSGGLYEASGVPAADHQEWMAAESRGKHWHGVLKKKHKFAPVKVEE